MTILPLLIILLVTTPAHDPASKPATLAEVRRAMDWSTFPRPAGSTWVQTDHFHTAYFAPGQIATVYEFLRKAFTDAGWTEEKRPFPEREPDKSRGFTFVKGGMMVEGYLEAKTSTTQVSLRSRGNPDAARLPRPDDAKVAHAYGHFLQYTTAAAPEAAAAFCKKAFTEQGWRFTPTVGAAASAKRGEFTLRFVQGAMSTDVRVTKHAAGGAEVNCYALLRSEFDPADVAAEFAPGFSPTPLTRAEALKGIDLRQLPRLGNTKPQTDNGVNLHYQIFGQPVDKVAAFYRKHLTDAGWKQIIPTSENFEGAQHRFEKDGCLLSLELRWEARGNSFTRVQLENHGNVDVRRVPFPSGAEIPCDRRMRPVMIRTILSPDEAAAYYRQELPKLGWTEKGKDLAFIQNGIILKLYVGTPTDGTTPVQVGTNFRDE